MNLQRYMRCEGCGELVPDPGYSHHTISVNGYSDVPELAMCGPLSKTDVFVKSDEAEAEIARLHKMLLRARLRLSQVMNGTDSPGDYMDALKLLSEIDAALGG